VDERIQVIPLGESNIGACMYLEITAEAAVGCKADKSCTRDSSPYQNIETVDGNYSPG